jgi:putative transposase
VQHNPGRLERLQALKAEPPCWGYRRLWAYLRGVDQLPVHKKRLLRLMREHHRLVPPQQRLQAQRTPTRSHPKPTRPHAWWGMDMTTVLVQDGGWVDSVVVRDGSTKTIVGYQADLRSTAPPWLAALAMAVNRQCPHGVRGHRLSLLSDHGGQPTSVAFMQACSTLGMQPTFPSDNPPKSHADAERMMRTRQEECLWRHEWTCPFPFSHALGTGIEHDHAHDLHSALGYKPPREFEREYDVSHGTQLPAA